MKKVFGKVRSNFCKCMSLLKLYTLNHNKSISKFVNSTRNMLKSAGDSIKIYKEKNCKEMKGVENGKELMKDVKGSVKLIACKLSGKKCDKTTEAKICAIVKEMENPNLLLGKEGK